MTAPSHLSRHARAWWSMVHDDYMLSPTDERLLTEAATAWDRIQQARAILEADGLTYRDRFGAPRRHPATSIEAEARIAFARLVRELDLEAMPLPDPRPPRRKGR